MLRLRDYAASFLPRTKTSQYHRVDMGESVESWGQRAGESLRRQHPWTGKYDVRVEITTTDDVANAIGYFYLLPRQIPPNMIGMDTLPSVRVPIIIADRKLLPLDTYIHQETFLPLSEDRVRSILSTGDIFMPVTHHEVEQIRDAELGLRGVSSSSVFGGAGGMLLGHSVKSASVSMETAERLGMGHLLAWARELPSSHVLNDVLTPEEAGNPWVRAQVHAKTSSAAQNIPFSAEDSIRVWARNANSPSRMQPLLEKMSQLRGYEVRRSGVDGVMSYRPIWAVSPVDGKAGYGDWTKTSMARLSELVGPSSLERALPVLAEIGQTTIPCPESDTTTPLRDLTVQLLQHERDADLWLKTSAVAIPESSIRRGDVVLFEEGESKFFPGIKISQVFGNGTSGATYVLDVSTETPVLREAHSTLRPLLVAGTAKLSAIHAPAGTLLGYRKDTGELVAAFLDPRVMTKTSSGATAALKDGAGSVTLTGPSSGVIQAGGWTLHVDDVCDVVSVPSTKTSAFADKYQGLTHALARAKSSAALLAEVQPKLRFMTFNAKDGTFNFDTDLPLEYLSRGSVKGSSAPEAAATLLCMGMGAHDALACVKLAAEEGRSLFRFSDAPLRAQEVLRNGDAALRAVIETAESVAEKISMARGAATSATLQALAVMATYDSSVLAKTSSTGSGTSLDVLLSLDFLSRDNILKFANFLPIIEQCQGYLCALRIASRLGLDEVSESACTSAIDSMEPIIFGLRSIRHVLRS
jgi:hypothetical protein